MPRQRRLSWLGLPHLVIAEANGGACLFESEEDFQSYIAHLRQMVRDRLVRIYGFCLTKEQIRLVLMPYRLQLSRVIQRLHGSHTLRMNQKMRRKGHLFSGRFRSIVFAKEELPYVVRSVHLWPVRSGLSRRAESYPFSSHHAYVHEPEDSLTFLETSDVLVEFAGEEGAKRRAFMRFVEQAALDEDDLGLKELWPGLSGRLKLDGDLSVKMKACPKKKRKISLSSLAGQVSLLLSVNIDQLRSLSRRQDLVMARRLLATAAVYGLERSITEVALFLNRDKAQISRLVGQGMDLLENEAPFLALFEALKDSGDLLATNEAVASSGITISEDDFSQVENLL